MNKLRAMNCALLIMLVICMIRCPQALSQNETDALSAAKAFVTAFSKNWGDLNELKLWADPAFRNVIDKDPNLVQQTFKAIGQKLGNLKSIRSVNPIDTREPSRIVYLVDIDYDKGPAKMKLDMDLVGKTWKVRSVMMDSKLLTNVFPSLSKENLTGLQHYVNTIIPKLGRTWDFAEFKAEADPRMFSQTNEIALKKIFTTMTAVVGPITAYKNSQLVSTGAKNGVSTATYKAFFTAKNGDGLADITVSYEKNKYRIVSLNIAKKMGQLPGY